MSFQVWKCISLFLFLLIEFSNCADVDFCSKKFNCKNESNIICQLGHNCDVSKHCKRYRYHPITPSDKKLLVELHNFYRNKIAIKRVLPNIDNIKLPTSADMKELVWDKELEFLAQCWANQCPDAPNEPLCFKNTAGVLLGQILQYSTSKEFSYNETMQDIYLDIKYVTPNDIASYNWIPNDYDMFMIHNFLQLVYSNATQFGCARSSFFYDVFDENAHLIVCFYNRAILPNKRTYVVGKPCSLCSDCHNKYKGLCKTKQFNSYYPNICKYSNSTNCTSTKKNSTETVFFNKESSAPKLCKNAIKFIFFIWITIRMIKDL